MAVEIADDVTKKHALLSELENLLSEEIASAKGRAGDAFNELAGRQADTIILHGAGNLGRKTLRGLRKAGLEPVAFSDNNASLWGKSIEGVPVLSPADAASKFGKCGVFVVTVWGGAIADTMADRCRPLLELGCEKVLHFGVLFWKYPKIFGPHYSYDLPHRVLRQAGEVRRAFDLWNDDASRAEYVAHVRWRLHMDFHRLPQPVSHAMYFPDDLVKPFKDEVFIDCGAYFGDTLRIFLEKRGSSFAQYHALEADPANANKLRGFIASLPPEVRRKILVHELAVGATRGTVRFGATGTASSAVGQGSLEVGCAPLDEVFEKNNPTWIKMDIEGSEQDALAGSSRLIAANSPMLSICVYHQQNHLWTVPLQMKALLGDAHFYLRPHVHESWDLVCYAVPNHRHS